MHDLTRVPSAPTQRSIDLPVSRRDTPKRTRAASYGRQASNRAVFFCFLASSMTYTEIFALPASNEIVAQVSMGLVSGERAAPEAGRGTKQRNVTRKHTFVRLEKLVEILRKKVNGATAVNRIRDALAAGASYNIPASPAKGPSDRTPPSSASSSSGNEERSLAKKDVGGDGKEDENDDDDDDGNIDDGNRPAASRSDKNPPIANDLKTPPTLDNGINLSGPVTDL